MADGLGPSEFGFSSNEHGEAPFPHVPNGHERLRNFYRSGDASGQSPVDGGENFSGLLPYEKQLALRTAEGVMSKGEAWQEMLSQPPPPSEAV